MPTDWESCYRAGDTPWDKKAAAPPLLEWLAQPGHGLPGRVLVPGCGLGHDVRAIAAQTDAAEVVGLDISPAALALARAQTSAGIGAHRAAYVEADLFDLPPSLRGGFDWVFEHTCFCAIDPARRPDYVRAVAEALRPGGQLLAVFYLDPWGGDDKSRPPGGGPPFPTSREELDALFAGHFELLEEAIPTRAYRGRKGRELRRWLRRINRASRHPLPINEG